MTTAAPARPTDLPAGAVQVRPGGLLSNVRRDCADHRAQAHCVGRDAERGCLVFWCAEGEHHFHAAR